MTARQQPDQAGARGAGISPSHPQGNKTALCFFFVLCVCFSQKELNIGNYTCGSVARDQYSAGGWAGVGGIKRQKIDTVTLGAALISCSLCQLGPINRIPCVCVGELHMCYIVGTKCVKSQLF